MVIETIQNKEVLVMADENAATKGMADEVATRVAGAVAEQMAPLAAAINKLAEAVTPKAKPEAAPETKPEPKVDFSGPAAKEWIARQVSLIMAEKALPETKLDMNAVILGPLAGTKGGDVRVKDPTERYSDVKTALCYPAEINGRPTWHPRAGMPVASFDGRQYNMPTERTKALAGAFLRWQLYTAAYGQQGAWSRMSEHFRDLVHHLLRDCTWTGCLGGWEGEEITRQRLGEKATVIINDVTSGGSYAAPDVFEEAVMVAPNLFGELFPLVTLINLPRGASVDGFTWTDPSWTSGYTEGTSATCVTTDSIIGNLDTTIFGAVCPIKMGLDWESDSPVNWGAFIVDRIGQRLQVWLDEQIAVGDGTTEPEGIFTKSGVTSVSSDNGTDGPFTMGDLESLAWGLGKAYRTESPCVYVTSDTVYRRARAVPTANSGTVYETRALGMDHSSYKILEWPCKVQNSITTGSIAFWAPKYYRLYRRLGMQVRSVTEGQTLALENTRLLVFRARFGGKVGIAASVAKMTDGPQTG